MKDEEQTARTWVLIGGLNGFIAVAFGAFGAHALKDKLDANHMTEVYKTGVQYHAIHALALLLIALLCERAWMRSVAGKIGGLFTAGILLFSGSLYLLAVSGTRILGAITPLGGVCFLSGWALLIYAAAKK